MGASSSSGVSRRGCFLMMWLSLAIKVIAGGEASLTLNDHASRPHDDGRPKTPGVRQVWYIHSTSARTRLLWSFTSLHTAPGTLLDPVEYHDALHPMDFIDKGVATQRPHNHLSPFLPFLPIPFSTYTTHCRSARRTTAKERRTTLRFR